MLIHVVANVLDIRLGGWIWVRYLRKQQLAKTVIKELNQQVCVTSLEI